MQIKLRRVVQGTDFPASADLHHPKVKGRRSGKLARRFVPALTAAGLACMAAPAFSAEIAYISSSNGYMLHKSGNQAVTANWQGQAPIQGFSGYGMINIGGTCLTGKAADQPLTWE